MSHRPGHPLRRVHGKLPIPPTVLAPGSPLLSLVLPKTPSSRLRTLEVILRPPRDCLSWFSLCSSSSTLLVYFLSGHPISFLSLASFICCNLYPPTRVPAYASGRLPALGSLWASAGLRSTANTHTHTHTHTHTTCAGPVQFHYLFRHLPGRTVRRGPLLSPALSGPSMYLAQTLDQSASSGLGRLISATTTTTIAAVSTITTPCSTPDYDPLL